MHHFLLCVSLLKTTVTNCVRKLLNLFFFFLCLLLLLNQEAQRGSQRDAAVIVCFGLFSAVRDDKDIKYHQAHPSKEEREMRGQLALAARKECTQTKLL